MSDDAIDDAIRTHLSRGAVGPDDTDDALERLRPRARRARRRRRDAVALAASGAMGVVVISGALLREPVGPTVEIVPPAGPSVSASTSVPVPDAPPSSTVAPGPDSTGANVPSATTPAPSVPGAPDSTFPAAPPTTPTSAPADAPTSSPSSGDPAPQPRTVTPSGTGGSITVRFDGASLTLEMVSAAPGFIPDVTHEEPDRVEVRFESDAHETRIEIRVDDGVMGEPEIDENS